MIKEYNSTCPLDCWDACSLKITVENDRIVNIRGDMDHKITQGFICTKGKKHLERLYRKDRIREPYFKKKW